MVFLVGFGVPGSSDFFEQYVDLIRAWYTDFGGYIPDPNEIGWIDINRGRQPEEEGEELLPHIDPIELEEEEEINVKDIPF